MELAEGASLEQELDAEVAARKAGRGPLRMILSEARIKEVAVSLLQGLACFHLQGLVHMDIKPANVLRRACGQLMLADFDCMRQHDASGHVETCAGTPAFMAPEVRVGFTGERTRRTSKLDTYSVGALLACCASYHGGTSGLAKLNSYLRCGAALPSFVPAALQAFIDELVAEDAEQRPTVAEALRHPYLAPAPPPRPQHLATSMEKKRRAAAVKAANAAIPGWC
ncbi:Serine/threonine-protein kinase pakH [Tetrabaena socialis]|uniref:Serine/threonine-protein kinase pakH n=1 Tax=Tetrabaena socialis TaxID=47790 RepID=A0A2J8A988_9CHLO|nr:Serine/threonine-protein kinase pakH [Tetrabaena socialis]|eukprot:PNH09086.1 Serine/threonine-protein kinase pakH [Tetrabaena socialis]